MSTFTAVKCDGPDCKEQMQYDPLQGMRPQDWHLPDSWLTLIPGDTQLHRAWHFCSFSCLHEWTIKEPHTWKGK